MKKLFIKFCCILLSITVLGECILCNNTTYAANSDKRLTTKTQLLRVEKDNNTEVLDKIISMLNIMYNDSMFNEFDYSNIKIGDYISTYNSDTNSEVYIYPIFANDVCIMTAEVGNGADVSLSNDISVYNSICEKLESDTSYVLYIDDGIYYAQDEYDTIELVDTGIIQNEIKSEFEYYSYNEKISNITHKRNASIEFIEVPDENTILEIVDAAKDFNDVTLGTVSTTISTSSTGTPIKNVTCNITKFVTQGNYGLCWAATVATIIDYIRNSSLTAINIADMMGIDYNAGATVSQVSSALQRVGLSYKISNSKLAWSQAKTNITLDKPFALCLYTSGAGHMLTGFGYGCELSDLNSASRVVYAWDPNGYKIMFGYNASTITTSGYSFNWSNTLY